MNIFATVILIWSMVSVGVGLLIGGMIRLRDLHTH